MGMYRLTAKRDMCSGKLKKGTSVTISTTGSTKPQIHQIKKELGISSAETPSVTDSNFVIEEIS
jgi:hypothetical protein